MFKFHHHYVPTGVLSRQPFKALSFSVRCSAYSHIIRARPDHIGTGGLAPPSQVIASLLYGNAVYHDYGETLAEFFSLNYAPSEVLLERYEVYDTI